MANPVQGSCIWRNPLPYNIKNLDDPSGIRLEFPYLFRFKNAWYCVFREACMHYNHPSGICRLIRSTDGVSWETAHVFAWEGADVREIKLSLTPHGQLMAVTTVYFVSSKPRVDGKYYQLDEARTCDSTQEHLVSRQSVSWLSNDGSDWRGPFACETGINNWRWSAVWHDGMAYSVGYAGPDKTGTLYRSRDGMQWRPLVKDFFPEGGGTECDIAFTADGTAVGFLRAGPQMVSIGRASGPYYNQWTWTTPTVTFAAGEYEAHPAGGSLSAPEFFEAHLGGPHLLRLTDGRLVAAGRVRGPHRQGGAWRVDPNDPEGKEDGRVVLFTLDHQTATLHKFAEVDGTSYPGVIEHEGELWVTSVQTWGETAGVYLVKIKLPG